MLDGLTCFNLIDNLPEESLVITHQLLGKGEGEQHASLGLSSIPRTPQYVTIWLMGWPLLHADDEPPWHRPPNSVDTSA
jgi:hypothetical protein